MEGRCAVETWAEFGCAASTCTAKVVFTVGAEVLLCAGSDEVHVFSVQEKKLTAVLRCPGPVGDLVQSDDKQLLYVACDSGVYSVNLPSLLPRTPDALADDSSRAAVLEISSDRLAVGEEGVCSVLLVGAGLLTLSQRDALWWLTLYKVPVSGQSPASSYEKLTELSVPVVSAGLHADTEGDQKRLGRRPVLICVHSSDEPPPSSSSALSSSSQDGHYRLEPVLFKLLFGVDAALVKSPIILCGLPDGRLCFFPLRLPGLRVRVLHSLEQPVVLIGTSVVTEPDVGGPQCLVAVGALGRVVLVRTGEGRPELGGKVAGFTEGCVSGPVVCGCVDRERLYYSTGSDLLALDLPGGPAERAGPGRGDAVDHGEDTSTKTAAAALQSSVSLNVCRVIALAEPTHNTAGAVELVGLSARGRLQRITLPNGGEDTGLPRLPSAQVGQRVRDLLAAIGDVCERASVLKSNIQSKNQILRHLNQVLNISFLLLDNKNSGEQLPVQEKPIRCRAVTRWSRLLQKDSLNLTCVLENSSPYGLDRGWRFSVTVFPLSYSNAAGVEKSSRTFSFPFLHLHPGETLEVSLPLAAAGDTSFPVTLSCSLIFSLNSLLGEEEASRLLASGDSVKSRLGLDSSCVSLALDTLTVDWLDALQVNRPTASHRNMTSQPTDSIQAFLSTRQVRWSGRGEGRAESAEREQYSASVRVSSELLSATLALKTPDVDAQGPEVAPPSLCISLLDWLLSQGPGGGETGPRGDAIARGSSVVHAQGPDGHAVKLTAKEVNVGEESVEKAEGPLAAVEVQVESSSMAAVCGLHHAVLRRVQTLLQRDPEKAASTLRVERLGLRQTLQRAEGLLQEIQQCRIPEAFGVSRGRMTQSLLSVYRQLRENPLLII
ncbi:Fanconi anemia core complex-associated protein 100-like [Diretmus argenteus]